jgi:site-specific recombinase XerD
MNDLIAVPQTNQWQRLKALVLDSVSSPITKRVYNLGLDEFFAWYGMEPRPGFTKATVSAWRVALEARGLGSVSINVRITAVRKLAAEAADNGLLAPELAAGIARVKSAKSIGVRTGNWLSLKQAQALLNAPDITATKGLRDRAIIAVLLGCGLRRSEVAALTMGHIQQRDGRWCIVDLFGKHGRVRTVPVPVWVKVAIDAWTVRGGVTDGYVFRPVIRCASSMMTMFHWTCRKPGSTSVRLARSRDVITCCRSSHWFTPYCSRMSLPRSTSNFSSNLSFISRCH